MIECLKYIGMTDCQDMKVELALLNDMTDYQVNGTFLWNSHHHPPNFKCINVYLSLLTL